MVRLVADRLSERKWALIACGMARRLLGLFSVPVYADAIDFAERNAERSWATQQARKWIEALDAAADRGRTTIPGTDSRAAMQAHNEIVAVLYPKQHVRMTFHSTGDQRDAADLLREQLGNPFRQYTFDPAWRTETVVALASGIEADRAFDRMPILADALEEAGCDERAMLDHLRGPGPHARGCWVLDLILNREPELFALPPLLPTPSRMQLGPHTPPPEGMA